MMQAALINFLNTALQMQCYASMAPTADMLPCITTDQQGTDRSRTHGADGKPETGMITEDFEITAWSRNELAAARAGQQVIQLLESYRGLMTDLSSPNVQHHVGDIRIIDTDQDYVHPEKHYAFSVFVSIHYQ
jgi:hypothetical protein